MNTIQDGGKRMSGYGTDLFSKLLRQHILFYKETDITMMKRTETYEINYFIPK